MKKEYEQEPIMIEFEAHRTLKELAIGKAPDADEIPIKCFEVVGEAIKNIN